MATMRRSTGVLVRLWAGTLLGASLAAAQTGGGGESWIVTNRNIDRYAALYGDPQWTPLEELLSGNAPLSGAVRTRGILEAAPRQRGAVRRYALSLPSNRSALTVAHASSHHPGRAHPGQLRLRGRWAEHARDRGGRHLPGRDGSRRRLRIGLLVLGLFRGSGGPLCARAARGCSPSKTSSPVPPTSSRRRCGSVASSAARTSSATWPGTGRPPRLGHQGRGLRGLGFRQAAEGERLVARSREPKRLRALGRGGGQDREEGRGHVAQGGEGRARPAPQARRAGVRARSRSAGRSRPLSRPGSLAPPGVTATMRPVARSISTRRAR